MRRRHLYITSLFIVFLYFFAVVAILAMAREVEVGKVLLSVRLKERAGESLDELQEELLKTLQDQAYESANEIFLSVDESFQGDTVSTEENKRHRFLIEYEKELSDRFGDPGTVVKGLLDSIQRSAYKTLSVQASDYESGRIIRMDEKTKPLLEKRYGANGEIKSCRIKNVCLLYYKEFELVESRTYNLEIPVPSVHFYSGNDVLFNYSIAAGKGIYVTGRTSSIVGNIYAGTHKASEYRQAEARYGESGIYGGINVLETTLGVDADTVITTGDINVKQSFLMLGLEKSPLHLYAQALNRLDGFGSGRDVTVIGETELKSSSEEYEKLLSELSEGLGKLSDLSDYYDSNNDRSYRGKYRKILSNYDVILSENFVGAIVTAGNVIVESGVDVEGIILAGDRVYIQGNNNIVSNREILRQIIDEEYLKERDGEEDEFHISHNLMDYVGNIQFRGIF